MEVSVALEMSGLGTASHRIFNHKFFVQCYYCMARDTFHRRQLCRQAIQFIPLGLYLDSNHFVLANSKNIDSIATLANVNFVNDSMIGSRCAKV